MSTQLPGERQDAFLKLTRDWLYHNLVQQGGRHRFSEFEALIDLEWHARWRNRNLSLDGIDMAVPKSEVAASIRGLAKRWGWSPSAVRSFLKRRAEIGQLTRRVVGRGRGRRTIIRPAVSTSPLPGARTKKPGSHADARLSRAQRGHNKLHNDIELRRGGPPYVGTIDSTPTLEMGTGEELAFQEGGCLDGTEEKRSEKQAARAPSPNDRHEQPGAGRLCVDCGGVPLSRPGLTCFWCQEDLQRASARQRGLDP